MYSPAFMLTFSASPAPLIAPVPVQLPVNVFIISSVTPVICPQQTEPTAPDGDADGDTDTLTDGDTEAEGDNDGDSEGDTDGLMLGDSDGLTLADGLTLGLIDGLTLGETDAEGDKLGDTDGLTDGLTLADGLRLGDTLAEPVHVSWIAHHAQYAWSGSASSMMNVNEVAPIADISPTPTRVSSAAIRV